MSLYIGNKEVKDLWLGSKQVKEVWLGSTQVYPMGLTYTISNVVVRYSYLTQILADGSNYAYATGTVKVYRGKTLVETITDATLTPVAISNPSHFYASGNTIKGYHLHSEYILQGYTTNVTWGYLTATPVSGSTISQQSNTYYTAVSSVSVACNPSTTSVPVMGKTITCTLSLTRNLTYTWASGDKTYGTDNQGTARVYLDNDYKTTISHNGSYDVTFGENQSLYTVTKNVKMAYTADESYSDNDDITQVAGYYSYAKPEITSYGCDDVPASGGTKYFYGEAKQTYGWNGTTYGVGTLYVGLSWSVASYRGSNLGTTEKSKTLLGTSRGSCTSHGISSDTVTAYCYQQANSKTQTSYEISVKHYGDPTKTGTQTQSPSVSISSNKYGSASPCPASGGSATLSYSASRQERSVYSTPWTRDIIRYYSWTSGSTSSETSAYDSGSDTTYSSWTTVSYTPTISGSATGFTRSGTSVEVAHRHTTAGDARSVTYTASFDGQSRSVTLYQQYNRVERTNTTTESEYRNERTTSTNTEYSISVAPTSFPSIPALGSTRTLTTFTAQHKHVDSVLKDLWQRTKTISTYTSGDDSDPSYSVWSYIRTESTDTTTYPADPIGWTSQQSTWLSVSGNVITIDRNTNTQLGRTGYITFYNTNATAQSVEVTLQQQKAEEATIRVYDKNMLEILEGGSITMATRETHVLTVVASVDWTLTLPRFLPTGFSVSTTSGKAGTSTITLTTRRTITAPATSVTFTFTGDNARKEIIVNLDGASPEPIDPIIIL